jgi:F420-0:gamma-glutamyl ligase
MIHTADGRPEWFWELALAVNAAFKGLLGASGQSGHICKLTRPVPITISVEKGWSSVLSDISEAIKNQIQEGDVVVIAEKVVAAALQRIGPRDLLVNPDPKTVHPDVLKELANHWEAVLGFPIKPLHLLLADEYDKDKATIGADDHNLRCAEMANEIQSKLGVGVDVIISDTDTGLDTRSPLIGTVTIAATPIGATAGVNLYEAMRCAVAAEFTRGHDRGIPIVICVPAERRRHRNDMGKPRSYPGSLDIRKEPGISYA